MQDLRYLDELEAESIYILREVLRQALNPVLLYSVGKDSSVLLHLAKKAFSNIPFPLLHIDTGYKFPEMYEFRDRVAGRHKLFVEGKLRQTSPWTVGTERCCQMLKTTALLDALKKHNFETAIGGARRDEERSRSKERVFSFRDQFSQWNPKDQRPELWNILNGKLSGGESMRVFPLSNWTELDVWRYIEREGIDVVPLYFAAERKVILRSGLLLPYFEGMPLSEGEAPTIELCRYRSLGCMPCSGAVRSSAKTLKEIVSEMEQTKVSERATRVIDHDSDASMEKKKLEGYF